MTQNKKIHKSIEEIETSMVDDFRVANSIGEEPWCWINTKGKYIQCPFQCHDMIIMELFTDKHNPELGEYVIDDSICENTRENFIEKHWMRVSAEIISIPLKITARQKLAIEALLLKFPEQFFSEEKNFIRCYSMNSSLNNSKNYVIILENNKIKWETF